MSPKREQGKESPLLALRALIMEFRSSAISAAEGPNLGLLVQHQVERVVARRRRQPDVVVDLGGVVDAEEGAARAARDRGDGEGVVQRDAQAVQELVAAQVRVGGEVD